MASSEDTAAQVGRQLAHRRDELDLTQDAVARGVGITVNAVSMAERGRSTISKGKRARWEQVLRLKPGTIGRAYRDGSPIEALPEQSEPQRPYPDPADPLELAVWDMPASEADRRLLIDALRKRRAEDAETRRRSAS